MESLESVLPLISNVLYMFLVAVPIDLSLGTDLANA